MNRRRQFLGTIGTISIFGLAGCMDELLDEDDDQAARDLEHAQNLQNMTSDDGTTDSGSDDPGSDEPLNIATREDIVESYNDGIGFVNDGHRARNSGVSDWNDQEYSSSITNYESARSNYQDARSKFGDAAILTYDLDDGAEARELCEAAEEAAALYAEAMRLSIRKSEAGEDDRPERANELITEIGEVEREADRLNLRNPDTLASILDI